MKKSIVMSLLLLCLTPGFASCVIAPSNCSPHASVNSALLWSLGDFQNNPPPGLSVTGTPQVVIGDRGKAMAFNGKTDAFFIDSNPLKGLSRFTVEVVMRPDADGPPEQRFLHIGECFGDRMMIETRMTDDGQWYLDTYLRSGDSRKTLIDKNLLHPAGQWHHVALVVKDGKMRNYVNGRLELKGRLRFRPIDTGMTAIGVRQNLVYWFKGAISKIIITPRVLKPHEFMGP